MDFITEGGLPKSLKGNDIVSLIVDQLMKTTHYILIKIDYKLSKLTSLYVDNIVGLHGMPLSIMFDRDSRFTSEF